LLFVGFGLCHETILQKLFYHSQFCFIGLSNKSVW